MRGKTKAIYQHLQEHGSITSWEAFECYGATRLSSIIYNLKRTYNINIATQSVLVKDRYGSTVNIAKYILED